MHDKYLESIHGLYKRIFPFVNEALVRPTIQCNFFFALLHLCLIAEQIDNAKTKKREARLHQKVFQWEKDYPEWSFCS